MNAPSSVRFVKLGIRSLRNIAELEIEPAPSLNVIVGDNGQGKTSVLEAIYLVATSKSFRSERLGPLVREGDPQASVHASIEEAGFRREQRVRLSRRSRSVELDGKRPKTLTAFASRTPVVVFHPADLELVSGAASERRKLLDRVIIFVDPPGSEAKRRYNEALSSRSKILEQRGADARELEPFERVMAQAGARLSRSRRIAVEQLREALAPSFERLASTGLSLKIGYVAGGHEDEELFLRTLVERRAADLRRGAATFGPQRDELELWLDGRLAREHASQGQWRLLALSLKLAELDCIRRARDAHPVLLLDDVSSELDPERTSAVHDFVDSSQSQIFVTTTRPELFASLSRRSSGRAEWTLSQGKISPL